MRNEMIGAVVRRAMEHPEFRQRLIDDPQGALAAHGFALEQQDLDEIEKIRTHLNHADDVERQLTTIAEDYGLKAK